MGITPRLLEVLGYQVNRGGRSSRTHCDQEQRVCVLGAEIARDLFPSGEPLGRSVKLDDQWFEVIGVLASARSTPRSVGELAARNLNQDVYIPLPAFLRRFDRWTPWPASSTSSRSGWHDSGRLMATGGGDPASAGAPSLRRRGRFRRS